MERQPAMASITRNPSCCYIADDDDDDDDHHLPPPRPSEWFNRSLDDMEAGFSPHRRRPFLDSLFRRETKRYEYREPHFLDSCYLCKNTLRNNKDDIFMYRGDTPFCSVDCRQEQIELDQQMERNTSLSSSLRVAMRNKGQQGRSTSPSESPDHPRLCTDTVAVA